jgi:hypothetical protein
LIFFEPVEIEYGQDRLVLVRRHVFIYVFSLCPSLSLPGPAGCVPDMENFNCVADNTVKNLVSVPLNYLYAYIWIIRSF